VEAQILNGVGSTATPFSQIMLSQGGAAQNSGTYTLSGGAATLNYYAEFIQTASTVTAGAFSSNIQYTMQYQ
jgi:major type 1 subunit fimbrin (pilin)